MARIAGGSLLMLIWLQPRSGFRVSSLKALRAVSSQVAKEWAIWAAIALKKTILQSGSPYNKKCKGAYYRERMHFGPQNTTSLSEKIPDYQKGALCVWKPRFSW